MLVPSVEVPNAVFPLAVVFASSASEPRATFEAPEVSALSAFLPIAVLFPPETEASKAFLQELCYQQQSLHLYLQLQNLLSHQQQKLNHQ